MAENERMPATPAEARDALLDVFWDERNFMIAFGVVEVARLVLADPRRWREALGWAHEWGWDTHGYRCIRCGRAVGLPESPELCAGVPS